MNIWIKEAAVALAFSVVFFSGCSNEEDVPAGQYVDVAKNIRFEVIDQEFGEEVETRAMVENQLRSETIDLGDGLEAVVTVEYDRERIEKEKAMTRTVETGRYTVLAYQSGVQVGILEGTVSGVDFTFVPDPGQKMVLDAGGTYNFYCLNDKWTAKNKDVYTYMRTDAETVRVGLLLNQTDLQNAQMKFEMEHVGVRGRIRLESDTELPLISATLSNDYVASPINRVYVSADFNCSKLSFGGYVYGTMSEPCNFPASNMIQTIDGESVYVTIESGFHYFVVATLFTWLRLTFNSGTLGGIDLTGKGLQLFPIVPTTTMAYGNAYLMRVKLRKRSS